MRPTCAAGMLSCLVALGAPALAPAQDSGALPPAPEPPPPIEPAAPPPTPAPAAPDPMLADPPPPQTTEASPSQDERDPKRQRKKSGSMGAFGVGPAVLTLPVGPVGLDNAVAGVMFEQRTIYSFGGIFGLEWASQIMFHDFETMRNVWGWYFDKGQDEDTQAMKILFLWPGILLAPFFGANYSTGLGGVLYSGRYFPAAFIDFGGQLSIYLRPSEPRWIFDMGVGLYTGLGVDFSKHIGAAFRLQWGPPLIRGLFTDLDGHVVQGAVLVNILAN